MYVSACMMEVDPRTANTDGIRVMKEHLEQSQRSRCDGQPLASISLVLHGFSPVSTQPKPPATHVLGICPVCESSEVVVHNANATTRAAYAFITRSRDLRALVRRVIVPGVYAIRFRGARGQVMSHPQVIVLRSPVRRTMYGVLLSPVWIVICFCSRGSRNELSLTQSYGMYRASSSTSAVSRRVDSLWNS